MRLIALPLSFALMAFGAMPPEELMKQAPLESFDTGYPITFLAACIVHVNPGRFTYIPDTANHVLTITLTDDGVADFAVTLTVTHPEQGPKAGGHVEVRRAKGLFHVTYDQVVQPCLDDAHKYP